MSIYLIAKAHHEALLREAEQARLIREAKRAKRWAGKPEPSQAKGWVNRHLRTTRA